MSRWMSVRDFLRGGYRNITEPTVIANHGRPIFTVMPFNGGTLSSTRKPFTPQESRGMLRPQQED